MYVAHNSEIIVICLRIKCQFQNLPELSLLELLWLFVKKKKKNYFGCCLSFFMMYVLPYYHPQDLSLFASQ
jgi:hypothetical protein